jgi:hypothetical protein
MPATHATRTIQKGHNCLTRAIRHAEGHFVGMMSYHGAPVEEIARLAGHASSRTTEVIYRRELRAVITTGAEVMDQIFSPRLVQGTPAGATGLSAAPSNVRKHEPASRELRRTLGTVAVWHGAECAFAGAACPRLAYASLSGFATANGASGSKWNARAPPGLASSYGRGNMLHNSAGVKKQETPGPRCVISTGYRLR